MKIVLCGSMTFAQKMIQTKNDLITLRHEPNLNELIEGYVKKDPSVSEAIIENKIKYDVIKVYFEEIKNSDAIIVINEEKNGVKGYIGGNAFLEIGFAYVLGKKIFLLNDIPNLPIKDEIIAMKPIVLNGDLSQVK
jgi:predicted RNA-binding protein with PUA domain